MKTAGRLRKLLRIDRADGFSMTELIISMAIAGIFAVGIYSVYVSQLRQSSSTRLYNDLQNNLRFAMDYMKNELFLAGFNSMNPNQPISTATSSSITFEYQDDNITSDATYSKNIQVTYSLTGTDLIRDALQYNTTLSAFQASPYIPSNQTLATHVTALAFSYRKGNNDAFAIGTDPLGDIRTIRISLSGKSRKADPILKDPTTGGDYYRILTLTGEVKSRNLAIASNPFDETPPAIPTGLAVRDAQSCGRLMLEWNAVGDVDMAGYQIYYGLSAGSYLGKVRLSRGPGAGTESYTLDGLSSYEAPYYVTIRSYDRSANMSNPASEISGNPDPDSTAFSGAGDNGNDSTINPGIPDPPTGLAAAYPADEQVQLSWTPSTSPGVTGYRLFRATQADFSDEILLADENQLTTESTGYLDQGSPTNVLLGCQTHYYRIASIHCDASRFIDGDYTASDYATVSGTPPDGVAPRTPELVARPGFQRIILNLRNPERAPTEDPDFTYTEIYWNLGGHPTINPDGSVNGTLIPDYGGQIWTQGYVPPINFDSETQVNPGTPELQPDTTYYFTAIAYDTCGNHTEASGQALAEGEQCGDCAPGEPCDEVPLGQAPSGLGVSGCNYSVDLWWDPVDEITYRDHAGFRIFRQEGNNWNDSLASVELTGGNATWFSNWQDSNFSGSNPMQFGRVYSYKICSTDCYYEQHNGKSPSDWPDPGDDPDDNIECTIIDEFHGNGPLYIGKFERDSDRFWPVTGNALGGIVGIPESFRHNTVTFWIDNLAAGTLTQEAIQLTWSNPDLFLRRIEVGDDDTTRREVVFNGPVPVATSSNVTFVPPAPIDGLDDSVPMTFTFTKADGSVDASVDMRQEFIDIMLTAQNDSTGTSPCPWWENIFVPAGPIVSGVVQDSPENPTLAWPVPGDSGLNPMDRVIVPANTDVTVRALVNDTLFMGFTMVRLFYYFDVGAVLSTPPDSSDFTLANSIEMVNVAGNLWETSTPIPASNDSNVWYYILAVDATGNFDREPEIDAGTFQYYQQPPDICENTPEAPELSGAVVAGGVSLTWVAPTLNTDGSPLVDLAGYNIRRNDGSGWSTLASVDEFTTSYLDPVDLADLAAKNHSYVVTAFDACPSPATNESGPSAVYTECEGAPNCIFTVIPSGDIPLHPGDTFTIDLTVCSKQNGNPTGGPDVVYAQVCSAVGGSVIGPDADPIELLENGDTGFFRINAGAYGGRTAVQTHKSADYPASPLALDLEVSSVSDTIIVGAWSDSAYSDSVCSSGSFSCSEQTLAVTPDPCESPVVPDAPSSLVVVDAGNNCSSSREVSMSWTAPANVIPSSYFVYQCGDAFCTTETLIGNPTTEVFPETGVYDVGAKLNSGNFYFRVEAENDACPTDVRRGASSSIEVDPCL